MKNTTDDKDTLGNTSMIVLYNFQTLSFEVSYPLLFLHGCLKSKCKEIFCFNHQSKHTTTWNVNNEEFKVFVLLKSGVNKIILYDNESNELMLEVILNDNKQKQTRYILPVYIICDESNGSFLSPNEGGNTVEDAIIKLKFNCRLMQAFFAESLHVHGFERKTFHFAEDECGDVLIDIFHSQLNIEKTKDMSPDDLYQYFNQEIVSKYGFHEERKFLCFMSCTRYYPPNKDEFQVEKIMSYVKGHAALGGGNMALFGTGSLHTWADCLENIDEKFTDQTMIDRYKFFDDSCGRGSHGCNYSTTLGACIHELGHCFDLAHTPHGIMARGHDDMDYFFIAKQKLNDGVQSISDINQKAYEVYKGAHWYRSSAIILNYHKWFNSSYDLAIQSQSPPSISLHPNVLGPFGNNGPSCQKNQNKFSSKTWLDKHDLQLTGFVIYHDNYINGIQFLGIKHVLEDGELVCKGVEHHSERFGYKNENETRSVFHLQYPEERLEYIKLRSGAWIDGIQFITNKKTSDWLGGCGGDEEIICLKDCDIETIVITAANYVGSICFKLKRLELALESQPKFTITANNNLRLIEFYKDDGEVKDFIEYANDTPPQKVQMNIIDYFTSDDNTLHGMVFDNAGCKKNFCVQKTDLEHLP